MSRMDSDIEDFVRIMREVMSDALYAIAVRSYNDCNDCHRIRCRYRPKPGEMVRINCPLWSEGEQEE